MMDCLVAAAWWASHSAPSPPGALLDWFPISRGINLHNQSISLPNPGLSRRKAEMSRSGGTYAIGRDEELFCAQPATGVDHQIGHISRRVIEDDIVDLAEFVVIQAIERGSAYIFSPIRKLVGSQTSVVRHILLRRFKK